MPSEGPRGGQLAFELHFDESQVRGASFAPVPGLFSCSVVSLAGETIAALEHAAHTNTPVRLMFSDRPLLLDLVTFERKDPQSVRIVGHVLQTAKRS